MSMSDHIKQWIFQEFFANKVSFSWKTAKLDSFVLLEWENQHTYRKYFTYLRVEEVWHTVFNLLHSVRYRRNERKPQIGDRGSKSSCNQSVFNFFFSIRFTCSRSLFSFANILYFTWLILFDFILL